MKPAPRKPRKQQPKPKEPKESGQMTEREKLGWEIHARLQAAFECEADPEDTKDTLQATLWLRTGIALAAHIVTEVAAGR